MRTLYPKTLLDTYLILEKKESMGPIQEFQSEQAKRDFKQLETQIFMPSWWIRFGLFLATFFCASLLAGLFGITIMEALFSSPRSNIYSVHFSYIFLEKKINN